VPAVSEQVGQRLAISELNARLADVSFDLDLLPATYTALIRISLASGSTFALIGFLSCPDRTQFERAVRLAAAALAGFSGATAVALIGRSAKAQSQQIRDKWTARRVTSEKRWAPASSGPAAPPTIRGNRFPG